MTTSISRRCAGALSLLPVALAVVAPNAGAQDSPPPIVQPTDTLRTQQTWPLKANAEQTFTVAIKGLTGDASSAVLEPCWGFEIRGKGLNLPIGNPDYYGVTTPEPGQENTADGGVPGAVRQPDGTFVVPESHAAVGAFQYKAGLRCQQLGWHWTPADGDTVPSGASAARKRPKVRKAQAGSMRIELAGLHNLGTGAELVLRVRTGAVPAGATVKAYATTARYPTAG